ncbi:hypothetical protein XdyCFBP7245_09460 [Xanthomonas dyei]|uniref:Uncharacterized protein n=1 Tax=Xanthomonas dyei TaxID=743699 RepID=A0A2S7C477_9XANT|nr:hypothetical protein XdyCFBP7245_09460 [Xanthomonas dyei]
MQGGAAVRGGNARRAQGRSYGIAGGIGIEPHKRKRLHEGGVLRSGLAGEGALAKICAGWRSACWLRECSDAQTLLAK